MFIPLYYMNMKRSYNQYCGLAHALDLLGDRWTLLVVRELLLGPRRFGELQAALPGIGPNLLSQRLRDLRDRGIAAPEDGGYALTPLGEDLREPVVALTRWGLRTLGPPREDLAFAPRWLALTWAASFSGDGLAGVDETWEYRVDGEPFTIRVADGAATVTAGTAAAPDVVVTASAAGLLAVGAGALEAEAAIRDGVIHVAGDRDAFRRSVAALAPAGLAA